MSESNPRSPWRLGCLALAAFVVLAALIGGAAAGFASWQIGQLAPEPKELVLGEPAAAGNRSLRVDATVARVVLTPVPAGEDFRAEADFDPDFYALDVTESDGGLRIRFAPTGSEALALLRMKLGADAPLLRLHLPADWPVEIRGELRAAFAAVELGGTRARSLDLAVDGAATTVSFLTPLSEPMDSLRLVGDKGSIEVTGLGNASPARAELRQHLGELDLDLRGAWSRDARILIDARLAGGALWLPADEVRIEGLGDAPVPAASGPEGDTRPRLSLSVENRGGRMVVID